MVRRTIASLAAGLATVSGLTVAADSAAADTITQRITCYPGGGVSPRNVTITAPPTVTRGQPAPVFIKIEDTRPWEGQTLPAGGAYTRAYVTIGGDGSGTFQIEHLTNSTDITEGTPWHVERTAQLTFPSAGTVTLALRSYGVPLWYACGSPSGETPPVAETVTVLP